MLLDLFVIQLVINCDIHNSLLLISLLLHTIISYDINLLLLVNNFSETSLDDTLIGSIRVINVHDPDVVVCSINDFLNFIDMMISRHMHH